MFGEDHWVVRSYPTHMVTFFVLLSAEHKLWWQETENSHKNVIIAKALKPKIKILKLTWCCLELNRLNEDVRTPSCATITCTKKETFSVRRALSVLAMLMQSAALNSPTPRASQKQNAKSTEITVCTMYEDAGSGVRYISAISVR